MAEIGGQPMPENDNSYWRESGIRQVFFSVLSPQHSLLIYRPWTLSSPARSA